MGRQHVPSQKRHDTRDVKCHSKVLVADQGYDSIDHYTLETVRIFFVAFYQPETQFWMHAYQYCEGAYSSARGAAIAQATLDMLNAMRTTRPHTFNYTDPRCRDCSEFLTPEERYLMESFRNVRCGARQAAHMTALLLCEGNDPTAFLEATEKLNAVICGVTPKTRLG